MTANRHPVPATPPPTANLRVLLVDPVLFTAPYDAALSGGLKANAVSPHWATRALRPAEDANLPQADVTSLFYRLSDGPRRLGTGPIQRVLKGFEHVAGLNALTRLAQHGDFHLVHFQWSVLPWLDARAMLRIRARCPVVLTVHDLVPFNGKPVSRLQRDGFPALLRLVDRLIVHTDQARATLQANGIDGARIAVVPHGLLELPTSRITRPRADGRWRIVMFGRLQSYKGVDTLIDAVALLPAEVRGRIEVIIAGEALMPIADLAKRVAALGIGDTLRLDTRHFSDDEMAELLAGADCFVFPYRAIEASGVLHLVAPLAKWIIASDLGVFRSMIGNSGDHGQLTPPDDAPALAAAITASVGRTPVGPLGDDVPSWAEIGKATRAVYESAIADHARAARLAA